MFKALDKWFLGYLWSVLRRPRHVPGLRHLIFCICDHYEPYRGGASPADARRIVQEWTDAYPSAVDGFHDADGCPPRHTFFYPQEEYDEEILDRLAAFCRKGFGEVEIHLHHRHDTAEGLREKLITFRDLLHKKHQLLGCQVVKLPASGASPAGTVAGCQVVGLLSENPSGSPSSATQQLNNLTTDMAAFGGPRYAFIHGNWSLCNSRPDGDWCGVNEELGILAETGCYADFTFPSAPSPTQPRMVNAIYYAKDTPGRPRGADWGSRLSVIGNRLLGNSTNNEQRITNNRAIGALLLLTGPLALNWRRRKWGVLPRVENGDICGSNPPTPDRVRVWVEQGIGVRGRPDWVFVKLHTHGCVQANARVVLGEQMRVMHGMLQREYNDGKRWQLHYVAAREAYNLVKAAEAGLEGPPGLWRDYIVGRPFCGQAGRRD